MVTQTWQGQDSLCDVRTAKYIPLDIDLRPTFSSGTVSHLEESENSGKISQNGCSLTLKQGQQSKLRLR
jgi:hypothetical protein